MRWKIYHSDYPEDAKTLDTFELAKSRAFSMDHEFRPGRKSAAGLYYDGRTGIIIEPVNEELPEAELAARIKAAIAGLGAKSVVDLKHHAFDRLPCSRQRFYAIVRKHAARWGFEYDKAEYVPSGNRAFQRNHKRGRVSGPWLRKRHP